MNGSNNLSRLLNNRPSAAPRLERTLLKDQATELLRSYITGGHFAPGTKLVEREVADLLGISRAPARDALMQLEQEGLVISKPNGRYVIELSERDVTELYQVRLTLEMLAVELAAKNTNPKNRSALLAKLAEMEQAVAEKDSDSYTHSDLEMHRLIWHQANNCHLVNVLDSMLGPIFMFVAWHAGAYDWNKTLDLHVDLVQCINSGDPQTAKESLAHHTENALNRSLRMLRAGS
ncbi:MAG: GntR family transcriptional regulator [Chloroflexota bacterium]|nr:GntR family transcriptional regulator [Chloroflexota bacterium]